MKKQFHRNAIGLSLFILALLGCSKNDPQTGQQNCASANIVVTVTNSVSPSQCNAQDGSVTIAVSGGTAPYNYFVNTGSTVIDQSNPFFDNLFPGVIKIIVKDKFQCSAEIPFELRLPTKSGISYSNQVVPILNDNCNLAACHGGSLGSDRDWRSLTAIQAKLNNIQRVLALSKMPPPPNTPLTASQRDVILCWIADGAPNN